MAQQLMVGAFIDDDGTLHVSIPEMLEANGYPDTEEHREMMAAQAEKVCRSMGIEVDVRA